MSRRKPYEFSPSASNKAHWRSIEEKQMDPKKRQELAESERPDGFFSGLVPSKSLVKRKGQSNHALLKQPKLSRRGFLATTGATGAALTLQGCLRRPEEPILPFVRQPEYIVPGVPLHYATATQRGGDALGLLVTSHAGRPTKIEGNSEQSSSGGKTDLFAQQMIWDLYDPDRSQSPAQLDGDSLADRTYAQLDDFLATTIRSAAGNGGAGLRFLLEPTTSPTLIRLRERVKSALPQAKFHTYASVSQDNALEGAKIAFGNRMSTRLDVSEADVLVAIDSDFLGRDDGSVFASKGWGARRFVSNPDTDHMIRLYSVEGTFSITGSNADHRVRVAASECETFLKALATKLGERGLSVGPLGGNESGRAEWAQMLDAMADDLTGADGKSNRRRPGASAVVVGPRQPARVHALGYAINEALGSIGSIVKLYPAADAEQATVAASLGELVAEIDSVQTLFILGGNPVYTTPGDVDFGELLGRSGLTSVHLSTHRNETTLKSTWHIPMAHELEAWGDVRAVDGSISIQQPMIAPLYGGRSAIEVLAPFAGENSVSGHQIVQNSFDANGMSPATTARWRSALHSGVLAGSAVRPATPSANAGAIQAALSEASAVTVGADNFEVQFVADPALLDGRFSNNLWALELPKPLSKVVWDNAAFMSYATRQELGLQNGDMVTIEKNGQSIELPAYALLGHADHSITAHLGWGRTAAGRYGNKQTWPGLGPEPDWDAGGFDVSAIRSLEAMNFVTGVNVSRGSGNYELVISQQHAYMEGRPIAIDASLEEYRDQPDFASYRTVEWTSGPLWTEVDYSPRDVANNRPLHKWGMVVDLTTCTGCGTCTTACQAENNVPVVGKQEVKRGRYMTWIRIDRYFVDENPGDHQISDDVQVAMQPITCQHCEEAPCENVCPVNATAHSPEGLNDMAYNRCIGTRYCANNCPYKVRHYNYLDWHQHLDDPWAFHGEFPETRQMQFNPNVTVRSRGVMEKCSYCVQRIQEAKITVRREDRSLEDGDVISACQQVCPTGAIVFGDLNDSSSAVARVDATNRRYKLLAEVGAQPRTTFLGLIRNPNPELPAHGSAGGHDHEEAH